ARQPVRQHAGPARPGRGVSPGGRRHRGQRGQPVSLAVVTLSPMQERSIAESTARINVWTGSVRSGKTIASLLRFLIYVTQAPRGGHLVIVGKTSDTIARNVFEPLMDPSLTGPVARRIFYTRGAVTANILGRRV